MEAQRVLAIFVMGLGLAVGCSDGGSGGAGNDVTPQPSTQPSPTPDVTPEASEPPEATPCLLEPDQPPAARDDDWDPASGDLPPELIPQGDEFMVAVLPDTQIYAERFPETLDRMLRWIAEHAEAYNIVFVSHVGDIVQSGGAQDQWAAARAAYDWIEDIDLPHGFSVAGHDIRRVQTGGGGEFDTSCSSSDRRDCEARDFTAHFGPDFYTERDWYGGVSPSGMGNYQMIEVSGLKLIFIHLPQDVPAADAEWAGEVLDQNPGALAHLTTHRYLFDYRLTDFLPTPLNILPAGRFNALTYEVGSQGLMWNTGLTTTEIFEQLVAPHPNIWAVHCGHVDAEFWQSAVNEAGLPVYEVLVDYQNMSDGGGGFFRLLKFSPSEQRVRVISYSATTGELRANGDGFDHAIDILEDYRGQADEILESFGLDEETVDGLLADVRRPGESRTGYYRSLYCDGQRDSQFELEVDFSAYIEASR